MSNRKIGFVVIFIVVLTLTACGGRTELEGTWARAVGGEVVYDERFGLYDTPIQTVAFNGNRFTIINYFFHLHLQRHLPASGDLFRGYEDESGEFLGITSGGLTFNRFTATGTFSITDDRIEFIRENGTIQVISFSRTENTLRLGNEDFHRLQR